MISKFIGIKVVSESGSDNRGRGIFVALSVAMIAWLGFALAPTPYNLAFMFLNGLPRNKKLHEAAAKRRNAVCADILKKIFKNHPTTNGFSGMNLGYSTNGLLDKLLVDSMHAYDHGIIKHFNYLFLSPMPESMRDSLDILASKILTTKSGISSKYPRMTQSGGFSSYTMLSSDENVGQLLGLFVLLHTTEGRKIMEPRFNRNCNGMIWKFQCLTRRA